LEYINLHDWPTDKIEAVELQNQLAGKIEKHGNIDNLCLVAAVETSYGKNSDYIYASAVVTTFPEINEVARTVHYTRLDFPYIPGLFYFREGPVILSALEKIKQDPDIIIVHGHGYAHPGRCGMASLVGLAFDKPSIGCARKLLTGFHRPVEPRKGSQQPITINFREVGIAYRSKENVKPIFISPGHKCNLTQARDTIVQNLRGYRMPEPMRLAHLFANKYKRHREQKNPAYKQFETQSS